jgi:hypothetical protein
LHHSGKTFKIKTLLLHQNRPKMRLIINLILAAIIVGLVWILVSSIREPIEFQEVRVKRERAVVEKLIEIRNAQEMFRSITGIYANSFDTLSYVLKNDSFMVVAVIGDPDDPNFTGEITYDTTYTRAIDSIRAIGMSLDSLKFVPYGLPTDTFGIAADVITYQSTEVPVVEVGARRSIFMGKFADKRFARYDQSYDPNSIIKFGNLNAPNLSGNWE